MSTVVSGKKRVANRRKARRKCIFTRYAIMASTPEDQEEGERLAIGILTDIGPDGLGLIMDTSIKSGSKVIVTLHPQTEHERQLFGRVIWQHPLPSANRIIKEASGASEFFRVGVRLDVDNEEQNNFIKDLLSTLHE